jgi:xanthine dehydrogenase accessory factor
VREPLVLVEGGGEVGTAVALCLWHAGWPVVVCELPRPLVLRRHLSVAEAAFVGAVVRDGVRAVRVTRPEAAAALLAWRSARPRVASRAALPVYIGPCAAALARLRPAVVVDARMRRGAAEAQRGLAPLVIGLGPGFRAGETVDVVVETCPGPTLGQVLWEGAARPHVSRSCLAGRESAERYAYAPRAGLWRTARTIGDRVAAGEPLGTLAGAPVYAPAAGCLRGLVHDAVLVPAGQKLAAVHPGDWQRKEAGISWRAAAIAASVAALVARYCAAPTAVVSGR